jgi:hypothetical protein
MQLKTITGNAANNSVQIKSSNKRLQLVFSFEGKLYYLSTGYPDTPKYRKLAQIKASEIELDILQQQFDPTLEKYQPASVLSVVKSDHSVSPATSNNREPSVAEIWSQYFEWKNRC